MSDLVEFLRARLRDDESLAQVIIDGDHWHGIHVDSATEVAVHIERHDPARVLRKVERDRRIIELHGIVHRNIGWLEDGDDEYGEIPVCGLCVPRHSHFRRREEVPEGPCATVRLLALPYSDHLDYRPEWIQI